MGRGIEWSSSIQGNIAVVKRSRALQSCVMYTTNTPCNAELRRGDRIAEVLQIRAG